MHLSDAERQQFRIEPTPEVIQAAEATILAHERAIASVEERVTHLLNQVQDLRYEQARHRAAIARCRGLFTLARRLPEELLIKVFEHLVADGWTRAPVVVSHVCSAWRRAAAAPARAARAVYSPGTGPQSVTLPPAGIRAQPGLETVPNQWRVSVCRSPS